jgi:hypothetical protein
MVLPVLLLAWAQAATPTPTPTDTPPSGAPAWRLTGELHLQPRGVFVVNAAYNRGTLYPGSFVLVALPAAVSDPQFFISPQNTVLGFKLHGLSLGHAEISGALDVNLRSNTPLISGNSISPQFYDVHIQLETERLRIFVGQFPDVVLPFVPDTVNSFPSGYVPGAIGYARPQVRADVRFPWRDRYQLSLQGSLNRPIQTFELADELAGRQAGLPDLQGRLAVAVGGAEQTWERRFEVGLAGHTGRRRVTVIEDGTDTELRTWSVGGDLRVRLPTGTSLKGRLWWGALLGDYSAGIFQTINPDTKEAIRARGWWLGVQQAFGERWRAGATYGRDDPRDADLGAGKRGLNQAALVNVFWDASRIVGLGAEVSRWATSYTPTGSGRAFRGDLLFFLRF